MSMQVIFHVLNERYNVVVRLGAVGPNRAFERTRRQQAWLPTVVPDRFLAPAMPQWWRAAQRGRWAPLEN